MKFASVRLIAADIKAMVAFYEMVTGQTAEWLAPQFAEIVTPAATLAIGSAETVAAFSEGSAEPGANRTAILEFMVDDVDAVFARLKDRAEQVHEPKLLPWGNRSVQFRDPEGRQPLRARYHGCKSSVRVTMESCRWVRAIATASAVPIDFRKTPENGHRRSRFR